MPSIKEWRRRLSLSSMQAQTACFVPVLVGARR
jgi:hypothetical protein